MDFEVLEKDLDKALRKLPRELTDAVGSTLVNLVKKYRVQLGDVFPLILEELKPHLGAIGMEHAMGYLDTRGLEETVMRVLGNLGIKVE
jgi:hypothetical protein